MSWDAMKGDWVQIFEVILEPGQRVPQVPKDTSEVALTCLVKGFLMEDANLGDTVTITTVIGRKIKGKLVAVNPGYSHGFGAPRPGLMNISGELRRMLKNAC